jgi:pSer/pThr/pTyr-binding forkhead associated (FHA) protein
MVLKIETDIASHYLAPLNPPTVNENGYFLPTPDWVSNNLELSLFELGGSSKSWKCCSSGISMVGRNENMSIVLENLLVSRCHAAILQHVSGRLYLVDLDSSHGTFIGKQRLCPLTPTIIPEGGLLRFGMYGNQFVIKRHEPLKIPVPNMEADDLVQPESFINTLINRSISFPGFSCDMEIYVDKEITNLDDTETSSLSTLGTLGRCSTREDLHRTATLDSDELNKLQNQYAEKLKQFESPPDSPGNTSLSDSTSSDSLSSSERRRRRSDNDDNLNHISDECNGSITSDCQKRVRFMES